MKIKIWHIALVLVPMFGGILFIILFNNEQSSLSCSALETKINSLIEEANYCKVDSDCALAGGFSCPFGCFQLVHKDADVSSIRSEMEIYQTNEDCAKCLYGCAPIPDPKQIKCVADKCVEIELVQPYINVIVQDLKNNPFLYHNKKITTVGMYRWGFEDSNFDEALPEKETLDTYNIWIKIDENKTKLQNRPENFDFDVQNGKLVYVGGEGSFQTTIYGTFHAHDPNVPLIKDSPARGNFGHLGGWKHEIVADKIVFESTEVRGVTDKTQYLVGEELEIAVTINNNLEQDIWIFGRCGAPFILQKQETAGWEDHGPSPTILCTAPPSEMIQPYGEKVYGFPLKQTYEHTYFKIEPGRYRFQFLYSVVDPTRVGQRVQYLEAFSNEFTLGKKITSEFNARIVGSYTSPGESSQLAVKDNVVYLTDITQGLLAIDVADPTNPKLLDSIKIDGSGAYAVAVHRTRPYVLLGSYGSAQITLVDISDQKNQKIVATGTAKRSVQAITQAGSSWFLAIDGPELEVFKDIPISEELNNGVLQSQGVVQASPGGHVLSLDVHETLRSISEGGILDLFSTQKLVIAQGEKGLAIFDIPLITPQLQGTLDIEGYASAVGVDNDVTQSKSMVYVISGQELIIVDIAFAESPKIKGKISLAGSGSAVSVQRGIAAVAIWENGVELIDVDDPSNPVSLGVVDTPGRARDVAIQTLRERDDPYTIYVADDRDDLQIIEFRK